MFIVTLDMTSLKSLSHLASSCIPNPIQSYLVFTVPRMQHYFRWPSLYHIVDGSFLSSILQHQSAYVYDTYYWHTLFTLRIALKPCRVLINLFFQRTQTLFSSHSYQQVPRLCWCRVVALKWSMNFQMRASAFSIIPVMLATWKHRLQHEILRVRGSARQLQFTHLQFIASTCACALDLRITRDQPNLVMMSAHSSSAPAAASGST